MNPEEKRAYSRGYNAGSAGRWPDHRPPVPPDEATARIVSAARALRDAVDAELGVFDEDEPFILRLGAAVDAVDAAMAGLSAWVRVRGEQP